MGFEYPTIVLKNIELEYYITATDANGNESEPSESIMIEEELFVGDINEDGTLNILDVVMLANMVLANEYDIVADVNEDGDLNVLDIVTLAYWVLNP